MSKVSLSHGVQSRVSHEGIHLNPDGTDIEVGINERLEVDECLGAVLGVWRVMWLLWLQTSAAFQKYDYSGDALRVDAVTPTLIQTVDNRRSPN